MTPIRVLIVDDHPVVRAGLRTLLAAQPELDVIAEAGDGAAALAAAADHHPDVVLCDLRLGAGPDGVAVTRALTRGPSPAPAVLILTTYDHDADIVRAVEAGAAGYLLKDVGIDELTAAILAAAAGETVLSPSMTERMIATLRTRSAGLSDRELEVLRLVADGLSNKRVAKTLVVSEATVKTHLNHAFTKLGVDNRTAAIAAARTAGMLE
jgi:DNA-binding NarL/FixJ family response regulator